MLKKYLTYGMLVVGSVGLIACANTEESVDETTDEDTEVVNEEENGLDVEDYPKIDSDYEAQYTTSINQELIDKHNNRYEEITEDFQNGDYTFEDPLVVQDPYGRSPLSALVLFETEEPTGITVTVEGKDEDTMISHTSEELETEHEIPVLGLYPDLVNRVILTAESEIGDTNETDLYITTDTVPEELFNFTVEVSQPDKMQEGLTFLSPSMKTYPVAVDNNGDVRWYSSMMTSHNFERIENGNNVMVTQEEGDERYNHLNETDMLGRVHQSIEIDMEHIFSPSAFHHDTVILPNNNYLTLLHDGSGEYVEDEIVELDRDTGEVVHRLNLKDVFPSEVYEEYSGHGAEDGDWAHVNTVWKLKNEEAILLSIRNQDMVMKLSYPEGEIDWILSPPENHHEDLEDYILESTDENIKYQTGQHAVEEMPDQDGNEDTLDIMLFDNNRIFSRGDEEVNTEYSRAVQYRINQVDHTVEEIWSYGEERGSELYSNIVSDADFLQESGNVLINFGRAPHEETGGYHSVITEVTKTDNPEVVYEITSEPFGYDDIDGYIQLYRAERMPLYPEN